MEGQFIWHLQSPKTLKESCLIWISQTLVRVVERIKNSRSPCRDVAGKNINNMDECLSDVRDLFVDVSSLIIQLIIGKISDVNNNFLEWERLWKDVLSVLLCKPIQGLRLKLTLCSMNKTDLEQVFKLIKESKSELTDLGLVDSNVGTPEMMLYIRDLPSLTHLEITDCYDSFLEIVSDSCPNLQSLRSKVSHVTSRGLKSLCLNPYDLTKRCQKFESLILDEWDKGCNHSKQHLTDGVVALLLGLPQLAVLEGHYFDMGKALRLAHGNGQQQDAHLQIRKITCTRNFCQQFHPVHLPNLCPHLKALTLQGLSSDDLASFPVLETLRKVTFIFLKDKWHFEQGVVPFLQKNGKFLRVLRFKNTQYINYTSVGQLCANLEKLQCMGALDGSLSPDPLFKKLESLKIYFYPSVQFWMNLDSVSQLVQLISNCHNLFHLWISSWELVMDNFMDIVSHNAFPHLVSIHFESLTLSITGETSDAAIPVSSFLLTVREKHDAHVGEMNDADIREMNDAREKLLRSLPDFAIKLSQI